MLQIEAADCQSTELDELFRRHHEFCFADTPPESIHMMDRADLASAEIGFIVARLGGTPVGMGAIKPIPPDGCELKSMHVLDEARGGGVAQALLDALADLARERGAKSLRLETGAQDSFAAARIFYQRAGFVACPPFGDYREDPMSVFLTLLLD